MGFPMPVTHDSYVYTEIRQWSISGECIIGFLYICPLPPLQVNMFIVCSVAMVILFLCYHSETTDSKLFDEILELVAGGCGCCIM